MLNPSRFQTSHACQHLRLHASHLSSFCRNQLRSKNVFGGRGVIFMVAVINVLQQEGRPLLPGEDPRDGHAAPAIQGWQELGLNLKLCRELWEGQGRSQGLETEATPSPGRDYDTQQAPTPDKPRIPKKGSLLRVLSGRGESSWGGRLCRARAPPCAHHSP